MFVQGSDFFLENSLYYIQLLKKLTWVLEKLGRDALSTLTFV